MRINKDRDGLRRVDFDFETKDFKSDKLELLNDILGTNFKDQIERLMNDLDDENKEIPKNEKKITYLSPTRLKKLSSNPLHEILCLDITLQELEEKLFIHIQKLEEEYPEYAEFQYEEEFLLTEDGLGTAHIYLTGLPNAK